MSDRFTFSLLLSPIYEYRVHHLTLLQNFAAAATLPTPDNNAVPGIWTRLQNGVGGISHYILSIGTWT